MFSNVIDGVDVFEVGKSQIVNLLGSYADIDAANEHWQGIGFTKELVAALVMVERYDDGSYGNVGLLTFVTGVDSVNEIVQAEREFDARYGKTVIYEVWHVVDDQKHVDSISMPSRYYYAATHDYGIEFCNDIHFLHRFLLALCVTNLCLMSLEMAIIKSNRFQGIRQGAFARVLSVSYLLSCRL